MAYPNFLASSPPDYVDMFMGVRKGLSDIDAQSARTRALAEEQKTRQWMAQIEQEKAQQAAINAQLDNVRADKQLAFQVSNAERDDLRAQQQLAQTGAHYNHLKMMDDIQLQKLAQDTAAEGELRNMETELVGTHKANPDDFFGEKGQSIIEKYRTSKNIRDPKKVEDRLAGIMQLPDINFDATERKAIQGGLFNEAGDKDTYDSAYANTDSSLSDRDKRKVAFATATEAYNTRKQVEAEALKAQGLGTVEEEKAKGKTKGELEGGKVPKQAELNPSDIKVAEMINATLESSLANESDEVKMGVKIGVMNRVEQSKKAGHTPTSSEIKEMVAKEKKEGHLPDKDDRKEAASIWGKLGK